MLGKTNALAHANADGIVNAKANTRAKTHTSRTRAAARPPARTHAQEQKETLR